MARQPGADFQNKFIRGLITETTELAFPKDAITEGFNCIFDETGRITRRKGLTVEASTTTQTKETASVWAEFVWQSVGGDGTKTFLVRQSGSIVSFYDLSSDLDNIGSQKKTFNVQLTSFIPTGSSLVPKDYRCSFSSGDGKLIIANAAIDPIVVTYLPATNAISIATIAIKQRDFVGLDDGLNINARPVSTVAALKTNNPKHYYNLLNQGWHVGTALADWDTNQTTLPSNSDIVSLFRIAGTGAFDNQRVVNKLGANTVAPKGHFVLDAFAPNRTNAMALENFSGANIGITETNFTALGSPSDFSDLSISNISNAFDNNTSTSATKTVGSAFSSALGRNYATATSIQRAEITINPVGGTTNVYLYAKAGTAPTTFTDGTLLTSQTFSASGTAILYSSNTTSTWNYIWVVFTGGTGTTVQEVKFWRTDSSTTENPLTYYRPSTCAYFAGRAWYAGNSGNSLNSTVFFSQVIERDDQYGKCYQSNDPTAEDFADLLATDGGVIKIPEAATIVHIGAYFNGLLVFATNGVWAITGSNRQYFTATSYGVRKISSIGTPSNSSFVDYKGTPLWWGETGIYTIKHDPNYDAYSVESLTDLTIYSFIASIPNFNRTFVKGAFNPENETITWVYNTSATLAADDQYRYTHALQLNMLSKAFYPFAFSNGVGMPSIRGIVNVKASLESKLSRLKFLCTTEASGVETLYFAEMSSTGYRDWPTFTDTDYQSYFLTGYAIETQAQREFQSNYVFVYLDTETGAGALCSSVFDWTTSASSKKWSTAQQLYNSTLTNRTISKRRLKMRGKGKALQLKFTSETGKPFTILGWSIFETQNTSV